MNFFRWTFKDFFISSQDIIMKILHQIDQILSFNTALSTRQSDNYIKRFDFLKLWVLLLSAMTAIVTYVRWTFNDISIRFRLIIMKITHQIDQILSFKTAPSTRKSDNYIKRFDFLNSTAWTDVRFTANAPLPPQSAETLGKRMLGSRCRLSFTNDCVSG